MTTAEGILSTTAARAAPKIASSIGSRALTLGLGTPALMYDVMAGNTGERDVVYGFHPSELGPGAERFGLDPKEPIPEMGGYSYDELVNDPDYIALAKEYNMPVQTLIAEYLMDTLVIPKQGPKTPSAFTMEELEELYGDTPFFQEYKENVPLGDKLTRGVDRVLGGIGSLLNPLGKFEQE